MKPYCSFSLESSVFIFWPAGGIVHLVTSQKSDSVEADELFGMYKQVIVEGHNKTRFFVFHSSTKKILIDG